MKSKVPPLALGGAIAVCVAVLGLAFWMLVSGGAPAPAEADLESHDSNSNVLKHPESAQPLAPDAGAHATGEGARVPLTDESAARVLPQVEFELRTSLERPLANARTLLFRGEELLGSRICDSAGISHFDAGDGSAQLIVVAKDMPAQVREVPLVAGRHVLVLERGVAVSGKVRVVGGNSQGGVTLMLTSDRPLVDESSWPSAVRRELDIEGRDKLRLATETNEAGEFEFTSLGSPWSGKLELGEEQELLAVSGVDWTPDSGPIRLDDPIEGLILDVAALPLARGRVVVSAGGAGVARASVNGQLAFEPAIGDDEGISANFDGRASADGSFSLPIHRRGRFDPDDPTKGARWPPLRSAMLTLDGGENIPRRRLELSGTQLPEGFDFGELVLERGATLEFIVVDGQSKPLAGAVGRLDGERSEPSDESGHASIAYAPGVRRPLGVSLAGYRDARVDVPAEVSEALVVVLTRTTRLTIVVQGPGEVPMIDVLVQVNAQFPPGQRQNRRNNNRTNEQRTDERGHATFGDLPPSSPARVVVRDAMGAAVAEQTLTLEAEEWRTIQLSIPRALLSFNGVVRDEAGLPLADAGIEFGVGQGGNNTNVSTRSDADGRFSFSGLGTPSGTLRVRKNGFAPVTIVDFQIPPPGAIADIRMERGLRLTLRVVDERGAAVRGDNLRLELQGERPFQGRRSSENEFDFSNLPRTGMTAIGMVGSREYRQPIEPLNGSQDFRVPIQGAIEIALRLDPALMQSTLRISLRARDDRRVSPSQSLGQLPYQTVTFAPLLPGDYQIVVAQFLRDDPRGNWVTVGAAQRVKIAAGSPQRIEMER